ncbi:unnamed protein product [Aureobasidium mustum]|uniref:Uncharacterized protein n=1 Tax=Aureobasidium mustum TaxID=2773714 RepID=A0A9N8JJY2_9PEZI|nr:unnamed protein product [Aureobasidium mustum]
MYAFIEAPEKLFAFREEHFIPEDSTQQFLNEGKVTSAAARQCLRGIGPALVDDRQNILEAAERSI